MTEPDELTITVPIKKAVQDHIERLQATLAKRNAEIERLQTRVAEAEAGEPNQERLGREYKRGWQDACNAMMGLTRDAARTLGKLNAGAWDTYLEAERQETARIRAAATATTPTTSTTKGENA